MPRISKKRGPYKKRANMTVRQPSVDMDIEVRVGVLEKLVDRLMEAVSKAELATKTADKALQLAQETLSLYASMQNQDQTDAQPVQNEKNGVNASMHELSEIMS